MAIYEYEILDRDGNVQGVYEVQQKMSEPALTEHPETGQPLRRILSATFAHGSKGAESSSVGDCASGACGMPSGFGGGCPGGMCGLN